MKGVDVVVGPGLTLPFVGLLVPATFAVVWVTRRGAPRLATAGALVALTGRCVGIGNLGGPVTLAGLTAPSVMRHRGARFSPNFDATQRLL